MRPVPSSIRAYAITDTLRGIEAYRVLTNLKITLRRLEVAPHPMQVNRVRHHRVIDQDESHALAKLQDNRLRFSEFQSVEGPPVPFHISREKTGKAHA